MDLLVNAVVFVLGALVGAFALKRNPVKGAKTLSQLEELYASEKLRIMNRLKK